jgi:PBP1b-binding outer membrane lipoprotein LpoB
MFRVIACAALILSGCAYESAPTQVVRKTVINVACPTD